MAWHIWFNSHRGESAASVDPTGNGDSDPESGDGDDNGASDLWDGEIIDG